MCTASQLVHYNVLAVLSFLWASRIRAGGHYGTIVDAVSCVEANLI